MRYKVIGPPGTGKTRKQLNEVHRYAEKGVLLNKIGYFDPTYQIFAFGDHSCD